jgi:hypothetical protein
MSNHCPICGSAAETLDKTGDADGFDCPQHGKFKVSSTTLSIGLPVSAWRRPSRPPRARRVAAHHDQRFAARPNE